MPSSAAAMSAPTTCTVFWFCFAHSLSFAVFSISGSASAATASVALRLGARADLRELLRGRDLEAALLALLLAGARRSASLRSSSRASVSLWSSSPSAATRRAMASGLALSAPSSPASSLVGARLARASGPSSSRPSPRPRCVFSSVTGATLVALGTARQRPPSRGLPLARRGGRDLLGAPHDPERRDAGRAGGLDARPRPPAGAAASSAVHDRSRAGRGGRARRRPARSTAPSPSADAPVTGPSSRRQDEQPRRPGAGDRDLDLDVPLRRSPRAPSSRRGPATRSPASRASSMRLEHRIGHAGEAAQRRESASRAPRRTSARASFGRTST